MSFKSTDSKGTLRSHLRRSLHRYQEGKIPGDLLAKDVESYILTMDEKYADNEGE